MNYKAATIGRGPGDPCSSLYKKEIPKTDPEHPMPDPNEKKNRTEQFPVGIAGVSLAEAPREIAPSDPPAWPENAKLAVVGKPTRRIDGRAKVTGAAKYTADQNLPGMLFARMLVSPYPSATIKSIDTTAAEKNPNVKAIHILDNGGGDQKYPTLRYVGQPFAAVAATSQLEADEAARSIKIDYDIKPFVVDATKAKAPDAPLVYTGAIQGGTNAGGGGGPRNAQQHGNIRGNPTPKDRLDQFDKAFASADVTVDAEYKTQVQTHSPLETHGVVADWKPDLLTVWASTQGTASVRDEFASALNLPKSKIRVLTEFMGGGFGAKFGAGAWGILAANLSKKASAPVHLMCDRRDQHQCTGNRPDSYQHIKIAAKKDGTLLAIQNLSYGTAGVGTGAGATGPSQNLYPCPTIVTEDLDVFTHAGPAASFRAPGHPQGAFAFEQAIDELAEKLGLDPLKYREQIDVSASRREERKIGAEKFGWANRKPANSDPGPVKRGIGMAQAVWYRMADTRNSHCEVRLHQDGSVEILSGVQDIGGGIKTALAQCVAEELGLKVTDITVRIGDTNYPQGNNSGGSTTTNSMTPIARNAAYTVKQQLLTEIAVLWNASAGDLTMTAGNVVSKNDPTKSIPFKSACAKLKAEQISSVSDRKDDYATNEGRAKRGAGSGGLGGVQFAEVSVDTQTGVIQVHRVVAIHDCGRPINPLALVSQINGGVIQGTSYALYENRILDRQTGIMVNPNLEEYKIVGSRETPQIEVHLIEELWGRTSTDAAGIGEPSNVATAAAIANAVYNAIGIRIREIPMTPAVVLNALATQKA
jgi:xanthine dehydrogenase YagR molybdenum-binding subunit